MESSDRFHLAGLALICLKNETKTDAEFDLRDLIRSWPGCSNVGASRKATRTKLELAKYNTERTGAFTPR